MQPVQVTMRPLPATPASPPLPARWAEAVRNVEEAQTTLLGVIETLDSALYLDEETWQHALPHAQFVAALQGQQRKIQALQQQLTAVVARLEAAEAARQAAEERARELAGELESNASVFKLHYDELMRRDDEIQELQAVISALSLGGGSADAAGDVGSAGRSGGGSNSGDGDVHSGSGNDSSGSGDDLGLL